MGGHATASGGVYVAAADLGKVTVRAGDAISPSLRLSLADGSPLTFTLATVNPHLAGHHLGAGHPTPGDIIASAKRFADFYHVPVNDNDCHNIAADVAAAAGAAFPTSETGSLHPHDNGEGGFWRVAYRGSDAHAKNWLSVVKPGDIVRLGWTNGGQHTTTVLAKEGTTLKVYDNYNDSIGIHTVDFAGAAIQKTVTIYRLASDHLYLSTGTTAGERLDGTLFDDKIVAGRGDDTVRGWKGDDLLVGGGGHDALEGGKGGDTLVGGKGSDDLYAGADKRRDVFIFAKGDSMAGAADHIFGFHAAAGKAGDKIDLSALGATWKDVGLAHTSVDTTVTVSGHHGSAEIAVMDTAMLHRADFIL